MNDRCQTYLIGTKDGVYASANAVRVADDEEYDPTSIRELTTQYYDCINNGVKAPPCIVAARYATVANPDEAPVLPARGG